jgi:hypothetical protein
MKTIIHRGQIMVGPAGEFDDAVFIDSDTPLVEELMDDVNGKMVSVRYFITDTSQTKSELTESLIKKLYGDAEANYGHVHSEYTGYLWTNHDLSVGGHDLISEIASYKGKFLHLEIEIHDTPYERIRPITESGLHHCAAGDSLAQTAHAGKPPKMVFFNLSAGGTCVNQNNDSDDNWMAGINESNERMRNLPNELKEKFSGMPGFSGVIHVTLPSDIKQ